MRAIRLEPGEVVPEDYTPVRTVNAFHDGPRAGLIEYQGEPYIFNCLWDEDADDYSTWFWLQPVRAQEAAVLLEYGGIWARWLAAYSNGEVTLDSHPALPEDQPRHKELQPLVLRIFQVDETRAVRATPEFAVRTSTSVEEWFVRWTLIPDTEAVKRT